MIKRNLEIDKDGLNEIIHLSKNLLRLVYVIIIMAIILGCLLAFKTLNVFKTLMGILKVISPLFIGFVFSWLFYPLHKKMIDKGINKIVSALLIFTGVIGVLFLFVYIFIPVLYSQVNDLISYIPTVLKNVGDFITNNIDKINIQGLDTTAIKQGLLTSGENYIVAFTSGLPNVIISFVKTLISGVGVLIISLVVGIYMLIDADNLRLSFYKILPKKNNEDYTSLIHNISENARKVINGTLLVAFMVFVCDTVGFALMGLNASVLFGLFCGLTDLIPYIGPYIGGAAAVIVGFTQSPIIGIGVLIIAVIVQMLESYILQPVVMSKAMQLHPVTIIISLLLFAYFFGIIGMIIATPCMAIIKELYIFIKYKIKNNKA